MKPGPKRQYDTRRTVKITGAEDRGLQEAAKGATVSAIIRECLFGECPNCGHVRVEPQR